MISIPNNLSSTKVTASRLAVKMLVMAVLVGLFSAVVISGFCYVRLERLEMQDGLLGLNAEAVQIEKQLKDVSLRIERDMMKLALSQPMHRILHQPPEGEAAYTPDEQDLAAMFAAVLRANPSFEQLRYVAFDEMGSEIVRVDRSTGEVAVTPHDALQPKNMEPYFDVARHARVNEIQFLNITLNREHGHISDPPTPMLRVLISLADDSGQKRGFLVINVNFAKVFDTALQSITRGRSLYVVNKDGDYLIHPDRNKEFAHEYGRTARIGAEFPGAADFMASADETTTLDLTRQPQQIAMGLRKVHFAPNAPDEFWGVGVAASRADLLARFYQRQRESVWKIAGAIGLTAIIAGLVTFLLTRPLQLREEEMADSRQFLDMVIANIPDIIFIKDSDLRIVSANDAFLSLYPPDQRDKVIGTTTLENYHPAQVEEFTREDRMALEKGYSQAYETIDFPDGSRRTLFTKKVGFTDHKGRRLLMGVSRDITELKTIEDRLVAANTDLERFAFIASHDLQEPLRMITNFNSLLKEEYADKLDSDARMYIQFSVDAATRMQRLINDLLEYSRMQQEDAGSTRVRASEVLDGVIENLSKLIEDSSAEITVGDLPAVYVNPMQLTRVFQNLISNAIKYRDPEIVPEITISATEEEGRFVFCVADNGIGIEKKYFRTIFQLFKRLHTYDKMPGTGIGLSICRKVVEGWGGEIWLESTPGEGSRFYFSVPAPEMDAEPEDA